MMDRGWMGSPIGSEILDGVSLYVPIIVDGSMKLNELSDPYISIALPKGKKNGSEIVIPKVWQWHPCCERRRVTYRWGVVRGGDRGTVGRGHVAAMELRESVCACFEVEIGCGGINALVCTFATAQMLQRRW
jgi:hypothetical protein